MTSVVAQTIIPANPGACEVHAHEVHTREMHGP